ncbi:MAG: hypothetical protein DDT20_00944 [Firmicutes bacterium]|nr:hypothetical protein [Bacillota bacterium]
MKHAWKPHSFNYPSGSVWRVNGRRCTRCGACQHREAHYLWMRVVGYQWWPLVGRCLGRQKVQGALLEMVERGEQ